MADATSTEIPTRGKILVIGAHTILGELLMDQLEAHPEIKEFWVLDLHAPRRRKFNKLHFMKVDLIQPGADAHLAGVFKELAVDTVVHCALKNNPSHHPGEAHELEVIGTINILSACKAAQVKKFVFCSTTMVYGASSKNPNYISESTPLAVNPDSHFVRDKVEAEKQVALLYSEAPQIKVTVLRFSTIVGPRSENYFTALLRRPVVATLLGYDPLLQFIHEDDAEDALVRATLGDYPGVFNIVGRGVIPLSYALREAKKVNVPILPSFAYSFVQVLWNLQLSAVPGKLLDYFRYLWVADGEKARRIMEFEPKFSSKDAFIDLARSKRVREHSWAQ